ncbi:MAG: hypothetical protein KDB23_15675 [Planctomycetales bacterium]|nr:hypothetical protein [Planctomycetales bacterium]
MPDAEIFLDLDKTLANDGPLAMLDRLAAQLQEAHKYHEWFEARKLRLRHSLGLPLLPVQADEHVPEATRTKLDEGLIEACREVGTWLLRAGRVRESWHYLRAVGDREFVRNELAELTPTAENLDEFLELWLHEGLDYERGFAALLEQYGTCNSITTYDSVMYGKPRADRAIGARLLVRHLHAELIGNLRAHLERTGGFVPAEFHVSSLIAEHDWLFADHTYHIDTTHLASVVRFARDVDDVESQQLASELAEYGMHLDATLQYPGDPPFDDLYPASLRYFRALLGEEVEETLEYFRERAEQANPREDTTIAIEVYVDLLARLGQARLAIDECLRLIPAGIPLTGRAPSLYELAASCGDFCPLTELSRIRGDLIGYALSKLSSS